MDSASGSNSEPLSADLDMLLPLLMGLSGRSTILEIQRMPFCRNRLTVVSMRNDNSLTELLRGADNIMAERAASRMGINMEYINNRVAGLILSATYEALSNPNITAASASGAA